jgi:hypothetical protein
VHAVGIVGKPRDACCDDDGASGCERRVLDDLDRERQDLPKDGVVVGDPDEVDDIAGGDDRVPVVVDAVLRPQLDAIHGEGFGDRGCSRRAQRRDALGIHKGQRHARRHDAQHGRCGRWDIARQRA